MLNSGQNALVLSLCLSLVLVCLQWQQAGWRVSRTTFHHVSGFFEQDNLTAQDAEGFDYLKYGLGLLDKSDDHWQTFHQKVEALKAGRGSNSDYKVFFIGRHGQGFHNVAETIYGSEMWNCYWSEEYTDGNLTWGPDAELTRVGCQQAQRVNDMWAREATHKIPLPQSVYVSPLSRAISTMNLTYSGILPSHGLPMPLIMENLRESIGLHTCDQRSDKSKIAKRFPFVQFEDGFVENDLLWTANLQEPQECQDLRTRQVMEYIFDKDPNIYISLTAHGGTVKGILRLIGREVFQINTGAILPLIIQAKRETYGRPPKQTCPEWSTKPACPRTRSSRSTD